jgi:peroxiredoxin Q/BCP
MRRLFRLVSAAAAATALLATPGFAQTLNVGDQAPDFKLVGSDGKTYSLSELKGKTVVLAWFPKAFTGG